MFLPRILDAVAVWHARARQCTFDYSKNERLAIKTNHSAIFGAPLKYTEEVNPVSREGPKAVAQSNAGIDKLKFATEKWRHDRRAV